MGPKYLMKKIRKRDLGTHRPLGLQGLNCEVGYEGGFPIEEAETGYLCDDCEKSTPIWGEHWNRSSGEHREGPRRDTFPPYWFLHSLCILSFLSSFITFTLVPSFIPSAFIPSFIHSLHIHHFIHTLFFLCWFFNSFIHSRSRRGSSPWLNYFFRE